MTNVLFQMLIQQFLFPLSNQWHKYFQVFLTCHLITYNAAVSPTGEHNSWLLYGSQPVRESGNAAHVSGDFRVVPAGVVSIMI